MRSLILGTLLGCLLSCSSATLREEEILGERTGRRLLDISINAIGAQANLTLQVLALSNFTSSSSCIFQGFPGSKVDMLESGPLVVRVPLGTTSMVNFGKLTNGAIVALYNQTANSTLTTAYNGSYGLSSATFKANDSSAVGRTAYITAGRVDYYNNSDINHSWNSPPSCFVNVTFVVVPFIPTPPPPAAPAPPATGLLSGLLASLPKAPCFCTPVLSGKTTCFNFNQAGSDINCAPMNGYQCTTIQAPAGLFTQQAGPVYDCRASTPGVSG